VRYIGSLSVAVTFQYHERMRDESEGKGTEKRQRCALNLLKVSVGYTEENYECALTGE